MRARAMGVAIVLTGCSLLVDPRADNEYDLVDGGTQAPDGGERDGGAERDGGVDAGPATPAAPVLRFPWNGFMTGSVHTGALPAERNALRPRFVWESSEGAERYEVQLSAACEVQTRETCTFDGAIEGFSTESEWRPEEALPVSVTAPVGRRYVWRARACNVAGCSAWSPVRYLDVGRQPSDFNGDGYADVLVGAPFAGGTGNAYLFHGEELGPPRELDDFIGAGVMPGGIGWIVAAAGDVNADGFPDAIVTAVAEPTAGIDAGRAYLLAGSDDAIGLDVARPIVLETLHPIGRGSFGFSVGGAGDIDGDGFADFVVGAPGEEVDAVGAAGRAYVYRGGPSLSSLAPWRVLASPSPAPAGQFGAAVSIAGDVDGDGFVDVVVGALGESGGAATRSGRVYVFASSVDAGLAEPMAIASPAAVASGAFGASVASSGDMDGDGLAELVIGAPGEGAGTVHVYAAATHVAAYSAIEGAADARFGSRISTSGDLDGDGLRDLVIGAFQDAAGPAQSGAAFVVMGTTGLSTATPTRLVSPAPEASGWFGVSVALATDVDGDGRAELLCGAVETVGGEPMAGRVYVFAHDGTIMLRAMSLTAASPEASAVFGSAIADTTVTGNGYET